jgi:co-chaperonin GroES (HSP10)
MTVYKYDKEGTLIGTIEKEEINPGYSQGTFLEAATTLLEREPEIVNWETVEWPFEELFERHLLVQIDPFVYRGDVKVPSSARRDPTVGRVVMVGPGVTDLKRGDRILYSQFAGNLLTFETLPKCRILSREEVLGKLKEVTPKLIEERA